MNTYDIRRLQIPVVRAHSLLKREATCIRIKHCNGKPWAQAVSEARFLGVNTAIFLLLGEKCQFCTQ